MTADDFMSGVRRACTGDPAAPLVLLGNIEVERDWARGEPGVPAVGDNGPSAVVARMDEFALLLGGAGDHVILKSAPDPGYLDYLRGLGLDLPHVQVTDRCGAAVPVTEEALESPALLARLRALGVVRLLPHGMSAAEEELCRRAGLAAALPAAALAKRVNSKIYSRRVAAELGLPLAEGWECESVAEFEAVAEKAAARIADGAVVGVKDAYGVSGKGIVVADRARRLEQVVRMVRRRAERTGDDRLAVVVEVWADKAADLNYHLTVGRDGSVRFDFVKEALTAGGVHKGHRFPARLTPEQHAVVRETAALLGGRLAADGYHGPVGVDALVRTDGSLLPVLEINARNNMSTYQTRLHEQCVPADAVVLARQYDVRLPAPVPFDRLAAALGPLLFDRAAGRGALPDNHATVNAAFAGPEAPPAAPADGRFHFLLAAPGQAAADALDAAVAARLTEFGDVR
ncbi:ATP-grasp domain-containing protein [Streptomyces sp. WAC 06738]|uniref:preATP grasp domain-containing protein n=1 Tax=Streptomyces sp. WAC 06738 TaxID=2203210 RepID=UPI001F0C3B2F|nr:ATP-grasp domain-containing protein [Streptomyces sp. WAC 06738]